MENEKKMMMATLLADMRKRNSKRCIQKGQQEYSELRAQTNGKTQSVSLYQINQDMRHAKEKRKNTDEASKEEIQQ